MKEAHSLDFLQKLVDSVPAGVGIYRVYNDGRLELVYLNEGYYMMIGTTCAARSDYRGFSVFHAVHKEDRALVMSEVMTAIREDRPIYAELRVLTGAGNYKWFSIRANIVERIGDCTTIYCAYSDIDQLKSAQILLEKERKKREADNTVLQAILSNLPGAVVSFEVDKTGIHMAYISEGCEKINGFTRAELYERLKDDAFSDVHPDDREEFIQNMMQEVKAGESFNSVHRVKTKGGAYTWVLLALSPVKKSGSISYYGVYLDINEQQEKNLMLNQMVDYLPGGVAIFKFGKTVETLYSSDGLRKINGNCAKQTENKLKGNVLGSCVFEDDLPAVNRVINEALLTGSSFSTTYRLKCMDGALPWIQVYGSKIRDEDDGQIYYTIFTKPTQESALYKSVVDDSTTAVLVADIEKRKIVFVNTMWKNYYSYASSDAVIGMGVNDVLKPEDIMISEEVMKTLPDDHYEEFHRINSNGHYLHVYAKKIQWIGTPAYIYYATDESEVQSSRKRLQDLINLVPGGIAIYDIDGDAVNLSYINDAYAHLLGDIREKRSQYLGRATLNAVHPEDKHIITETVQELLHGKELVDIQFRVPDAQNEYVWMRMVGSVVKREGKKFQLYCSYSNCNAFVKTQQELISNRTVLDQAMEMAQVMFWKYEYKTRTATDSGSLGIACNFPKVIENFPQYVLDKGYICEESIQTFCELYKDVEMQRQVSAVIRAKTPNKKHFAWYKMIFTPIFDEAGNYVETTGVSIDVTEQKEREQNYEEQLRLKQLIANKSIAVAHFNLTKNEVTTIDAKKDSIMAVLKAGNVDDVMTAIVNIVPDYQKALFGNIKSCDNLLDSCARDQTHFDMRHQLNNDSSWYESSFELLENPYTGDKEAIAVLNDITDEVRAEQVVNVLMKIDYESVFTLDADTGAPLPVSQSRLSLDMALIMSEQRAAGNMADGVVNHLKKYCIDADRERVILETSLPYIKEKLETMPIHTCIYTLEIDGHFIHKRAIYAYLDSSKLTILCAVQDITETYLQEKLLQQRLSAALQEAEDANQKKTDFFSQISHDMRTPMNGILGLAALSEEETDIVKLKSDITKIRESGEYLLSLINDTLDFQRIESGKLAIEPVMVFGQSFLDNIVDMIRPSMDAKHIRFNVENNGVDMHCFVRIDAIRVKQIIINLLSNAVKFTPENGAVTLSFYCTRRDDNVSRIVFSVRDTGIGMSKDFVQNRIFQPFSQEYNELTTQYAGSGLGLSIVHHLVELMGGTLHVESTQGVGSTFTVEMDLARVDNTNNAVNADKGSDTLLEAAKQLCGSRLLLAEDHPLNAEITRRLLQKLECEITWAKNGQEAVNLFAASHVGAFDAILMDIRMPVMNGLEAAKAIRMLPRADARSVPIIAMTANAYEEDVRQSQEAGMNAHLAKPVEPHVLYQTLVKYVHSQR